jgi:hypothetical protein
MMSRTSGGPSIAYQDLFVPRVSTLPITKTVAFLVERRNGTGGLDALAS